MGTSQRTNILPPKEFAKRVVNYALFSFLLLVISLGIGVVGYHYFGKLNWVDSTYNASLILTGMGQDGFFSPFAHRLMHLLRIEEIDE